MTHAHIKVFLSKLRYRMLSSVNHGLTIILQEKYDANIFLKALQGNPNILKTLNPIDDKENRLKKFTPSQEMHILEITMVKKVNGFPSLL